eukprot:3964366-Amphidinium_carterae.1
MDSQVDFSGMDSVKPQPAKARKGGAPKCNSAKVACAQRDKSLQLCGIVKPREHPMVQHAHNTMRNPLKGTSASWPLNITPKSRSERLIYYFSETSKPGCDSSSRNPNARVC